MTIAAKLDAALIAANRAITLLGDVSKEIESMAAKRYPAPEVIVKIQDLVASHFGFNRYMLLSKLRASTITLPRHIAMTLCRELTPYSLEQIASSFGRDSSSAAHAVTAILNRRSTDRHFAAEFQAIRLKVAATLNLKLDEPVSTI